MSSKHAKTVLGFPEQIVSAAWAGDGGALGVLTKDGILTIVKDDVRTESYVGGNYIRWSPDGRYIAAVDTKSVMLYRPGSNTREVRDFPERVSDVAWSPGGTHLAIGFVTGAVEIVDAETLGNTSWSEWHTSPVIVDWGPFGLVSASSDLLAFWNIDEDPTDLVGEESEPLWDDEDSSAALLAKVKDPHDGLEINEIVCLASGQLVSVGDDGTLKIWSPDGTLESILENPSGDVFVGLSATSAGDYVCAVESDGTVNVIDTKTCSQFGTIPHERFCVDYNRLPGVQPERLVLAGISVSRREVLLFDLSEILKIGLTGGITHYRNAKVVLVGDTGVGKSGLALALAGQQFVATESTHGRNVWTLTDQAYVGRDASHEAREVLLWDLAGQPGYRLFHRLSLREVAVAVIVFDSRSESDPFRGVSYWAKALDEYSQKFPARKLLVAARSDRGGIAASKERVDRFVESHRIDKFLETSAKSGKGVSQLIEEIRNSIPWESLPLISAPNAFMEIRTFVIEQKRLGSLLMSTKELKARLIVERPEIDVSDEMFDLCLGRLEATGLVSRISFGDRWLLQPELLDSYVAWLSQAARQEPDGLGAIDERMALNGQYDHDPLTAASDEQAMLVTAVEEVVGRGLALRVSTEHSQMIVFPSELKTDLPDFPDGYSIEVVYQFEGPILAIYASMTVKLINSLGFGREYRLFKNAAIFDFGTDQACGFAVSYLPDRDDTAGKIVVFFGGAPNPERKLAFLRYIDYQLDELANANSVVRERVYTCYSCDYRIPAEVVTLRLQRGHETLVCPVCGVHLPMDNLADEASVKDRRVKKLARQATQEQARQQRLTGYTLREELAQYHAFICYNSVDREVVFSLNRRLSDQGVITWIDKDQVFPGEHHAQRIEAIIDTVPCALVVMGPNSFGPWQEQEYYALLGRAVARRKKGDSLRIVPVILPGSPGLEDMAPFLSTHSVVDLRGYDPNGEKLRSLVAAILSPLRVFS